MIHHSPVQRLKRFGLFLVMLIMAGGLISPQVSAAPLWVPAPSVTFGGTGDIPIGTNPINLSVTFDNTASPGADNIGYGPFIDVYFPVNGADGAAGTSLPLDGVDYIAGSATYLGITVTEVVQTFDTANVGLNGCTAPLASVLHPYVEDTAQNPVVVCGIPGDKLVTFQLPFGSFTPDQPAATVNFQAQMSNFADLGTGIDLHAQGGFQFGKDPLDNPCCDPSIPAYPPAPYVYNAPSFPAVGTITPTLIEITKINSPPEGEVATGPNHPHTYTITVDIAPGQTVTNLDVTDYIDDNIVITGITTGATSVTLGGSTLTLPLLADIGPVVANGTANELMLNYASASGTVTAMITYYVPLLDASSTPVIPPTTGADTSTVNRATAIGDWDPLDPRDAAATDNAVAPCPTCPPVTVTHTNEPFPIQKTASNPTPRPGEVVTYTLSVQVSDYFALDDLRLYDVISDGQRLTGNPQISFTQHGATSSGAIAGGNFVLREYFTGGNPGPGGLPDSEAAIAVAGDTVLSINLSQEILDKLGLNEIIGGCVPSGGGVLLGNPACLANGPTEITITYQTQIQDKFTNDFPSGDDSVDHGDTLDNQVELVADTVLNPTDLSAYTDVSLVDNGSSSVLVIAQGKVSKGIYAIVRDPGPSQTVELNPSGVPQISPGDYVVFRLTYNMPSTDFEDFSLTDFLPLPVLEATDMVTFNDVISNGSSTIGSGIPTAGQLMWGPTTGTAPENFATRRATLGQLLQNGDTVPTITVPGGPIPAICGGGTIAVAENNFNLCFGDFDDPGNQDTVVDILFTVTVSDDPFADGLFLTNYAQAGTGATNAPGTSSEEIIRFELREPILLVKKGVADSNNPNENFTSQPGFTGSTLKPVDSGTPPWTGGNITGGEGGGSVNSGGDANATGLDAGDTVRFVITIQNTGGSAAYDITLNDVLPSGLDASSVSNFSIYLGDGTPLGYTLPGGGAATPADFFAGGIKINDPNEGACQHATVPDGQAVIVITYDLDITNTVGAGDILINTTTITNYAGSEGGPNHVPDPQEQPSDDAEIEIFGELEKIIVTTSEPDSLETGDGSTSELARPVLIGEIVTFQLTFAVPEGKTNNVQVRDNLPPGMQYVAGSASVTFDEGANTAGDITSTLPPNISGGGTPGAAVTFDFGNITNTNNDDDTETVIITFDAIVSNIAGNDNGVNRVNTADLLVGVGGAMLVSSEERWVTIDEPLLLVTKTQNIATGDAGDIITYTITVTNNGTAPAYDVALTDNLPTTYVTFDTGFTTVSGVAPTTINHAAGVITGGWDVLAVGAVSEISFTVRVNDTITPADTWTNTASVVYNSLLDADGTGNNVPGAPGAADGLRNGSGGVNDLTTSGTTPTFTASVPGIVKAVLGTSEAHTDPGDTRTGVDATNEVPLVPGEIIRYRFSITLIEGLHNNLIVEDLLPAGMEAIYDSAFTVTVPADVTTGNASLTPGATTSIFNDAGVAQVAGFNLSPTPNNLSFFFGATTTNTNTDNLTDELILIEFNVLVLNNNPANQNNRGDQLDNVATLYEGSGTFFANSNTVYARVVEPQFDIQKTPDGAVHDAGDIVTFTSVISAAGANNADAFNMVWTDVVPADVTYVVGSLAFDAGCPARSFVSDSFPDTTGLTATWDSFPTTLTCTVTFNVTVDGSVVPDQLITNTADITWTSLPGERGTIGNGTGSDTPGDSGDDDGERNGDSTDPNPPNDYIDSDTGNIRIELPAPVKSIIATSEAHTGSADPEPLAIGEVITYRLVTTVPEGTSPAFIVRDTLPLGLAFIADDNVTVTLSTDVSSSVIGTGAQVMFTSGGVPNFGGVVDTSGPIVFDLGDITNSDTDDGVTEYVTIEFTARVLNTADNNAGNPKPNSFTVQIDGGTVVPSNTVNAVIVEPRLAILKEVNQTLSNPINTTTFDAGDTVVYTITIDNLLGSTDAYDLVVTDNVSGKLNFTGVTFTQSGATNVDTSTSVTGVGGTVNVTVDQLAAGGNVILTVTTTVLETVTIDEIIGNTATVTYTSLPADGSPYERDGSGGVNDYAETSSVDFTVDNDTAVLKQIAGTSEADTAGTNVAIGEVITYRLVTTVTEGTTPLVTVNDTLVDGIDYVPNSARISYLSSDGTVTMSGALGALNEAVPTTTITPSITLRTLTFDLGNVVNTGVNNALVEQVIIDFQVVVVNDAVIGDSNGNGLNDAGDIWANEYSVTTNTGQPGEVTRTSNSVTVTVVEPAMAVTKSLDQVNSNPAGTTQFTAGDTVVYTLYFENTGNAPAYNLDILDGMDSRLSLVSVNPNGFVGYSDASTLGAGPAGQVSGTVAVLNPGANFTLTVTTTVLDTVNIGDTIPNTAKVSYTSLPGTNGTGDVTPGAPGSPTGERTGDTYPATPNDYFDDSAVNITIGDNTAVEKQIAGTSEADTLNNDVAIGEVITYRLVTTVTEGTTPLVTVNDTLVDGIDYVPNSARISYLSSDGTVTMSGVVGALNEAVPTTTITPSITLRTLTFDLGNVVNKDTNNGQPEYVIIDFQVVVVNDALNDAGDIWANEYSVTTNTGQPGAATLVSNSVTVTVVEPAGALVKTFTPDAGTINDVVTVQLVLTNTGNANMYDLVLTDQFDSTKFIAITPVTTPTGYTPQVLADTPSAGLTQIRYDGAGPLLPGVGNQQVFTFDITLAPGVVAGEIIPNTATATFTSLPGDKGTGDVTPGDSGDTDGERNGTGTNPPNDYLVTGNADLRIESPDLAITKTASSGGIFAVGIESTFTLTVQNVSAFYATGLITVTDSVPTELTVVSAAGGGWDCTGTVGQTVSCTRMGPVAPGVTLPAITITVNPTTASPISNTARVSADGDDTPVGNNESTVPVTVNTAPAPDLTITKTATSPFQVGSNATYSIVVHNIGTLATDGVLTVTDTLPTGLTLVSAAGSSWGCLTSGNSFTCTSPQNISAGADSTAINVTVTVLPAALPSVTNTAAVSYAPNGSSPAETNPNNNSDDEVTPINPTTTPDLTITKTATSGFVIGSPATFDIVVQNVGSGPTTGTITVTDAVPAELTVVSAAGTNWNCAATVGQNVSCTYTGGALAPTATTNPITVTVTPTTTTGSPFTNTATVATPGDSNPTNDSDDAVVIVTALVEPDLAITKTHTGNFVAGANGVFTLTIDNVGTAVTTGGITVKDTLPAGLTFVSGTGTIGADAWNCSESGQTVTCTNIGNLNPAGFTTITLTVAVGATATGDTNSATVSTTGDNNPTNDTDTDPYIVDATAAPDVAIDKVAGASSFGVGAPSTFTLEVTNTGSMDLTSGLITVTDSLPTNVQYVSASGTDWTCNFADPTITCTYVNSLLIGASTPLITITVIPQYTNPVVNTATVIVPGDTVPGNNSDTVTVPVTGGANLPDLSITKSHAGGAFVVGTPRDYTLNISNVGTGATTGTITVTDTLPAGMTFVSGTGTQIAGTDWTCGAVGQDVTCTNTGVLNPTESSTVTLTVNVGLGALGNQLNVAQVSTPGDNNPTNDEDDDPTTVSNTAQPDLVIDKSHPAGDFVEGDPNPYSYVLVVTNAGSVESAGPITVTDDVPAQYLTVNGIPTGTGWDCTATVGNAVSCQHAGPLAAGASLPPITISVLAELDGTFNNIAVVASLDDGDTGNNEDIDPTVINGAGIFDPPFGVKTVNADGLPILEWGMVWLNPNNVTAFNVRVEDPIPAGTTYINGSLTCAASGASTTTACYYDAINNTVVWEGSIAPDPGIFDGALADNEVLIIFQTTLQDGVTNAQNIAQAHWDNDGDGDIDDDIAVGEQPILVGASYQPGGATPLQPEDLGVEELPATGEIPAWTDYLRRVTAWLNSLSD